MQKAPKWIADAAERAVATYAEAFLGLLIASQFADLGSLAQSSTVAAVAAIPAGLSVLKSAIARHYGTTDSASLIA